MRSGVGRGLRRHRNGAGWMLARSGRGVSGGHPWRRRQRRTSPERKQIPINIDQYVCGKSRESEDLVVGANRGIRWAVVSLQSPPAGPRPEPSTKPVQMDQQQCVYIPRVVVVPVGERWSF